MKKIISLSIGNAELDLDNYAKKSDIKHLALSRSYRSVPLTLHESSSTSATYISQPLDKDCIVHVCFKIPNNVGKTFQITQRKNDLTHDRVLMHIPIVNSDYYSTNLPLKKGTILGIVSPLSSGQTTDNIEINGNNQLQYMIQVTIFDED